MIRITAILVALTSLYSCGVYKKKILDKYCKADSITITKIDTFTKHTRDTFYTKGDTITLHDTIQADCVNGKPKFKRGVGLKRSKNLIAKYNIDSTGALSIECMADSLMHVIDSLNVLIDKNTTTTISKVKDDDSEWWRYLAIIGWVLIILRFTWDRVANKISL